MNGNRFTFICTQLARLRDPFRADLHLHSIHSDGRHTLAELITRAKAAKVSAIALTDHDTTAGVEPLIAIAGNIEIIPGVEITCEEAGREIHLLAYWVDLQYAPLQDRLQWLRDGRRERAIQIAQRVFPNSLSIEDVIATIPPTTALGRRHVAGWLVEQQMAGSMHDAFTRVFPQADIRTIPKRRLPLSEAIELVHAAGGISSFAHPPTETTRETLQQYQRLGLDAVEAVYPWPKKTHGNTLRKWADELGLAISGGSDSHEASVPARNVGSRAINQAELDKLRSLASRYLTIRTDQKSTACLANSSPN